MTAFVLVHGAWGSSRSWRQVAPLLRAQGHDVFAPTLTGLGERLHAGGPQTDLSTHIQDVVAVIEHEGLEGIVLAGHSYGGFVVTGVADRVPERVAHLVYFDSALPEDGQSVMDLGGAAELAGLELEDGWLALFPGGPGGVVPPSRGHPIGTFREKLRLSLPLEKRPFSRTYVQAAGAPQPRPEERDGNFWQAAERVRYDPAWRYFELPSGHGVQREMPRVVAGILMDLAAREPPVSEL